MALGVVEGCQCKRRCCVGKVSKYGQYTRIIGRKRILTPQSADDLAFSSPTSSSFKRQSRKKSLPKAMNRLEMLPQDVLIHVLCGVPHGNLKHLILVSKAVHEAALMAKKSHFDFSTPASKLRKLTQPVDAYIENANELDDNNETPKAPIRAPRSKLGSKDLSSITVALFQTRAEDSVRREL